MGGEKPDDGQASTVAQVAETMPSSRDSKPAIDLDVGATIGRYRLVSRLGAGAMGVVWCAEDPQLDRKIAIKVVHGKLSRSSEASKRLLREARAMAKLSHRAVVTVHDAGDVDGRLFLAMELVPGISLGLLLRTRTAAERLDWRRWLDMMLAAGRGLEAAHGAGVLHRDFKPDNVLVHDNGRVCVADFGLATLGEDHPQPISERMSKARFLDLTTTGALLGTPAYMSPQQLRGEMIDARADQFNFCVATYEALYGYRPFSADGSGLAMIEALEAAIERGDIAPPPSDTQVPEAVLEVLRVGLAPRPEDRWPNMTALLAALERAAKSTRRTTTNPAIEPPPPSRLLVLVAIGGGALAILALVAIVLFRGDSRTTPTTPVPRKLLDVALKTHLAVTPDGTRFALSSDRLEVRELDGPRVWTSTLPGSDDVSHLAVTNEEVTFGIRGSSRVQRWRYATDSQFITTLEGRGAWVGETVAGNVFYRANEPAVLQDAAGNTHEWPVKYNAELFAISPNRERVAIIDAERFSAEIVIRDVPTGSELRSSPIENVTALAWVDDHTVVYATGTNARPVIFRMSVTDRFGVPEVIYSVETGWFGELAVGGRRMLFVEMGPKSRARVVDRATQFTRELDAASVGAALAWLNDDEFLSWNRTNQRVERRTISGKLSLTEIRLGGEPANATLSGDTLIAAVRTGTGRELVAHRIGTGERLWSHPAPLILAARCADDRRPPCFALRSEKGKERLFSLDPETGALGDKVLFENQIEDLAVNAAGDRVVLALRAGPMHEIATDGTVMQRLQSPFSTVRSVAYDREDGFLIAGTLIRNTFQVGRLVDGQMTVIAQADNDLLSLVRPSADGKRILVHARIYAPVLWEMTLP